MIFVHILEVVYIFFLFFFLKFKSYKDENVMWMKLELVET